MYQFFTVNKDIILLFATLISTFVSIIVAIFTYKNLKELKVTRFEDSRAYINFYIDKPIHSTFYNLIIKNFGKSAGKVLEVTLDPPLDNSKSRNSFRLPILTEFKNIYLAPNQSVKSIFDFVDYPDKSFKVIIKYETLGKIFTESYDIDLSYRSSVITTKPTIKDNTDALKAIHQSIEELSDKFS